MVAISRHLVCGLIFLMVSPIYVHRFLISSVLKLTKTSPVCFASTCFDINLRINDVVFPNAGLLSLF